MKVSIIVPIYNIKIELLEKCIDSIINQSLKDIEIILLNDGSNMEEIDEVCKKYSLNDSRVRYVNKCNEGCSKTRNLGVELAKSKYVIFIDADDYVEQNMIERLYTQIEKEKSDVCICGYFLENNRTLLKEVLPSKNIKDLESALKDINIFGYPVNKIYKKNIILDKGILFPEDIHMSEDLVFNFKYFYYCKKISIVDTALYHYLKLGTGASANKYKYKERFKAIDYMSDFYKKYSKYDEKSSIIQFIYKTTFIMGSYSILEKFRMEKDEYFYEYYKEVKKYKKQIILSKRNILYFHYREFRLRFIFIKKILKHLLTSMKIRRVD